MTFCCLDKLSVLIHGRGGEPEAEPERVWSEIRNKDNRDRPDRTDIRPHIARNGVTLIDSTGCTTVSVTSLIAYIFGIY